ncbi:P-loop containing nucleoside triphosphate hydrolase protein [Fusarium solani]|uniref:P-loop containing nucleoside triphosphate hydrolase protein n=1 Tax=Fusarium solani TaxID=169388 RepID=A0A9P9KZ75_FUSSL|nr:P-loop containing nucleoside triphosphate hydrolase protein [Fusarium solani]KAH7271040.1 P-loop containing nucleoside triphosphate hydrolase protein [Fusarium solani]
MSESLCLNDGSLGPGVRGCRGDFDFTQKFERIFLQIIPAAVFVAAAFARVVVLSQRSRIVGGLVLQSLKAGFLIVYSIAQLATLILVATGTRGIVHDLSLAGSCLTFVASLFAVALSYIEHSSARRPSTLLAIYILLTLLFDIVQARTAWLIITNSHQTIQARLFTASIVVKLVVLCLETIPKTRWIHWNADEHSPEESSSVLSLGVYAWLNKLFLRGYRDVMDIDDLYPLDEGMTAGKLYSRFSNKIRAHKYPNEPNSGLLKDLCRTLPGPFLYPVAPRIALIAFKFCQPFFIDATLEFLQLPETPTTNNIGYGLIGAVFLIYSGIALSFAFYGYYRQKALTMIRGCLCAAVYRKTTEMKLTSADDSAALTLMSTDIDRVLHGAEAAHELWANTIEVSVGCWLLYNKVGVAFVSPLVIIIISGAILGWILALVGKRQNEWMKRIQNRVGLTANAISHMKLYKISGITGPVADLIQSLRVGELKVGNSFRLLLILAAVLGFTPLALSPVVTLAFTSASLGVSTIFTSLSYIFLLSSPLINMFQNLPRVLAGLTCTTRIQKFLVVESRTDFRNRNSPQSSSSNSEKTQDGSGDSVLAFSVENGFFGWGGEKTTLNQINCSIPAHKLTIVVGEVASGKTTFCKALLGEVPVSSGTIQTYFPTSRIGYCEQNPFLYNATFKENITGHCAFDQKKYDEIIEATMLSVDVALLPQGHNTKIGSNGIMLSGGQKQRVSVARALYSEADVMIFDDVLSGLDNDTEAELFRRVYGPGGITRRRNVTVVICTHSVRHLPTADHIIALGSGGTLIEQGTFSELMENNKYVHSLGVKHGGTDTPSTAESIKEQAETVAVPPSRAIKTELDDKSRQQGDWSIYTHYFKSVGFPAAFTVIFAGIMFGVTSNASSVWLKFWSEDTFNRPTAFYVGVYALFRVVYLLFLLCNGLSTTIWMTASAGTELHKRAITTVVAAPLRFFTTTDSGIVTNLFSQDMTLLDNDLPLALTNFTLDMADSMGMAAVIASASPYLAASYPFLFIILYFVQKFYLRTSRQVRLLDLEAKSPLYTHFIDTIKGVATIRAFGWQDLDISHNHHLLDTSQRPAYLLGAIQQWLISTLHLVVTGLAVLLIALATQMRSNAGITGASLVSLLSFSDSVTNLIRSYTLLETSLGAVARLRSFSENVKPEDQPGEDVEPPESWPQSGNIEINDVSASYEPESLNEDRVVIGSPPKLALSNLKLSITPGQKVAICGRTGSGKSTMILLLLRLLDPLQSCSRNMEIDDIPLHKIDRSTLRKRIIAIPQDAVFLPDGSSIKANIDPLDGATESECVQVLDAVRLSGFVEDRGGLNAGMSADDLSAGQKQLFSLGRAILRRRVRDRLAGSEKRGGLLLLDEVSSSVDKATDRAMQEIIRDEFESYTIVMVSHRLEMVMDFFDRVVVLDKGAVVESGGPRELVDTPGSRFGELWGIEHDDAGSSQQ